jgi:serine/threonine protein kinase
MLLPTNAIVSQARADAGADALKPNQARQPEMNKICEDFTRASHARHISILRTLRFPANGLSRSIEPSNLPDTTDIYRRPVRPANCSLTHLFMFWNSVTKRKIVGYFAAAVVGALFVAETVGLRSSMERWAETAAQAEAERHWEQVHLGLATLMARDQSRAVLAEGLRPLRAILARAQSQRDPVAVVTTLADAFSTAAWWEPFRSDFAISGISLVSENLDAAAPQAATSTNFESTIVSAASKGYAAELLVRDGGVLLTTALRVPLDGREWPAVLVLARKLGVPELTALLPSPADAVALELQGRRILVVGSTAPRGALDLPLHDSTIRVTRRPVGNFVLAVAVDVKSAIAAARPGLPPETLLGLGLVFAVLVLWLGQKPGSREATRPSLSMTHTPAKADPTSMPTNQDNSSRPGSQTTLSSSDLSDPGVVGRYTLIDLLGEGGMAQVFTAVMFGAEGFQRKFVVKRLRPELAHNREAVSQFIDEAKLGSSLVHSNIVPVFDFGKAGGQYFMAMEYILGRDLAKIVERSMALGRGALPLPILLLVIGETLKALDYAHTLCDEDGLPLGLIHRDVSPSNILVSARGEVKLFDFGVVKAPGRTVEVEPGVVVGNISFMAPEQARGLPIDDRADLFSLALVIFYCATGRPLYQAETVHDLMLRSAVGPTERDWQAIDDLPAPLSAMLHVALQPDPGARFPTAISFASALSGASQASSEEMAAYVQALFEDELTAEEMRLNNSPALSQSGELRIRQGRATDRHRAALG